mgnify:CR=1 FL=1
MIQHRPLNTFLPSAQPQHEAYHCLELVGEERGDLVVVGVYGAEGLGVVGVQPLEELLREERVARLRGVEAVRGLCVRGGGEKRSNAICQEK